MIGRILHADDNPFREYTFRVRPFENESPRQAIERHLSNSGDLHDWEITESHNGTHVECFHHRCYHTILYLREFAILGVRTYTYQFNN